MVERLKIIQFIHKIFNEISRAGELSEALIYNDELLKLDPTDKDALEFRDTETIETPYISKPETKSEVNIINIILVSLFRIQLTENRQKS